MGSPPTPPATASAAPPICGEPSRLPRGALEEVCARPPILIVFAGLRSEPPVSHPPSPAAGGGCPRRDLRERSSSRAQWVDGTLGSRRRKWAWSPLFLFVDQGLPCIGTFRRSSGC